jgi:SAM-dependent methyltransferase
MSNGLESNQQLTDVFWTSCPTGGPAACDNEEVIRSSEPELLDVAGLPEAVVDRAYRDLTRLHRALGNIGRVARAIRRDPLPVQRVLDIGCGYGGFAADIRDRLGVEVVGVDLKPPPRAPIPIVTADAVRDPLPSADIAYAVCLVHHLTDAELSALIHNVGRSCRRFVIVDLVRHWLPMALFRTFVTPFFSPVAVADGIQSIRRAYTPPELKEIVAATGERFRHSVAPFYVRQSIEINY